MLKSSGQMYKVNVHRTQFAVPFLNTKTSSDIRFALFLLPVWWCLGVDQIVYSVLGYWVLLKWHLASNRSENNIVFIFALILLGFFLISFLGINEPIRYVTFLRNWIVLSGCVFLGFVIFQCYRNPSEIVGAIKGLVGIEIMIVVAAMMAVIGVNIDFDSPASLLMPDSLQSKFLENMVHKTFARSEAGRIYSEDFVRPVGLMMYPNYLAGIIVALMPFKLFLFRHVSSYQKAVFLASLPLDIIVLLSTLSRSAWLSACVGVITVLILGKIRIRTFVKAFLALLMLATVIAGLGGADVIEKRFTEKAHSNTGRMLIYTLTISHVMDDPAAFLFGHGTQMDSLDIKQPMGSHSTYLSLLFRHGVLALTAFLGMILLLVWQVFIAIKSSKSPMMQSLMRIFLFSIAGSCFQLLFVDLDGDAIYTMVWWSLLGLSLSAVRAVRSQSILVFRQ